MVDLVKKQLRSYRMFLDYSNSTGDHNTKRFSYFNEAPKKVIEWVEDSPKNEKNYHSWIDPSNGQAKIRSAATKGGLRDFAKVIEDNQALELLREDPMATVEDAMTVVKQNDIKKEMPFINNLLPLQSKLNNLNEEQIVRVHGEPRVKVYLKSLKTAIDNLLNDLDQLDK